MILAHIYLGICSFLIFVYGMSRGSNFCYWFLVWLHYSKEVTLYGFNLWNLLRLILWLNIWSIFENTMSTWEECTLIFLGGVFWRCLRCNWFIVSFKSSISLLIFWLVVLSVTVLSLKMRQRWNLTVFSGLFWLWVFPRACTWFSSNPGILVHGSISKPLFSKVSHSTIFSFRILACLLFFFFFFL